MLFRYLLTALFVSTSANLYSQTVVCSVPYESTCYGDSVPCSLTPCDGTYEDDYECPSGASETQSSGEGNEVTYHLGLLQAETPGEEGYTYWNVGSVECSTSRLCKIGSDCNQTFGLHLCKEDPTAAWVPYTELLYSGAPNTECEVVEEEYPDDDYGY